MPIKFSKRILSGILVTVICLPAILFGGSTVTLVSAATVTLYNFESGTQGWVRQTYTDTQACIAVSQSSTTKYQGTYSLKMSMDLVGGHANKSKGEAYVDRGSSLLNLKSMPYYIWVYCPTGSNGNVSKPNGMQVFFKDSSWRNWYSPWQNIGTTIPLNTWTRLTVTLGTTTPAYVDTGFDNTKIRVIGIKMATGNGSTATYYGPVYIDYVNYNDTIPPAAPTNIKVTNPGTGGKLNLSWTNPTDRDFNHIHIYRSTTAGSLGTLVYDNVTGTSKQDTGLTNGTRYYYTLRSVDNVGNVSTNTTQYSGVPTLDTTPPAPPTNISVTNPATGGTLNLSWTNPTDSDFNHIHIYRSTTAGSLGTLVYDNVTGTSKQDTGLTNGTRYYYTLRSVDNVGNVSTNTTQYSGVPTAPATSNVFWNFEDGTLQGWISDCVDGLTNTTARAYNGTRSITCTVPTYYGQLGLGGQGYIEASSYEPNYPYRDLSLYTGVSAWIYLGSGLTLPSPLKALMTIYTNGGGFYRGDHTAVTITSSSVGKWIKLTFNFASEGSPILQYTTRIGVRLEGTTGGESGSAPLYIDYVEGVGYSGAAPEGLDDTVVIQEEIHYAAKGRPEQKIITPNNDSINDTVAFGGSSVKIYDITGRLVRSLNGTAIWNGRDDDNDVVRNGVYIYQYDYNEEKVSGTIAVAR